ncbi:MAG: LysR family transcriptional regulator [Actinomycetota bacterium]
MQSTADFTLRQIEYFVAVARSGSIKDAAVATGASAPAVSLAIRQLEHSLQAQLLVRQHAKGVSLTAAGQRILAECRALLLSAEAVSTQALESARSLRGSVRIGCFAPFMPFVAPIMFDEIATLYPEIDLQVEVDPVEKLRAGLLSGDLDFAVLSDQGVGRGIASTVVGSLRPHVIVGADHALASRDTIHLRDLADEPLITLDLASTEEQLERILRTVDLVPRVTRVVSDLETVRSLVARGLGYGIQILPIPTTVSYEGRAIVRKPIADDVIDSQIVIASADGVVPARRVSVVASRFALAIESSGMIEQG